MAHTSEFIIMVWIEIVKASIRFNFCEAHKGLKTRIFSPSISGLLVVLMLLISGSAIAQSNMPMASAKEIPFSKKINIVISASSAIAVDRFYGKALGLTRLPDENVDNAYPIMRYQLESSDVRSELHFVIAREKLPKLKGGAGVARGIRLLSLNFPQEKKSAVLRRLHISGRNPVLEARTVGAGERYEFGTVVDADGNQVQIQFFSDKMFVEAGDSFQIGLIASDKKALEQSLDKFAAKLFCGAKLSNENKESELKNCGVKFGDLSVQVFQAKEDLEPWGAVPDKQIGYSLIQIQNSKVAEKHRQLIKQSPTMPVGTLINTSITGLKVKRSFLVTLSDGVLIEVFEP